MHPKSVLVIGATGRTGTHVMQQLFRHPAKPDAWGFCRNPSKLDNATKNLCSGLVQGDARVPADLERALRKSMADLVVVAVGKASASQEMNVRTSCAEALVEVLKRREYRHVHVVVVSSVGAGKSPIHAGMGRGMLMKMRFHRPMKDHGGQERTFLSNIKDRTMIIRPTLLTEDARTGRVFQVDGSQMRLPTRRTDRTDLAHWLVQEAIYGRHAQAYFGAKPVTITCV